VWLEQSYVQILVVVATIQMRTLKTEVEKGSMRTAFGHGLLDPKTKDNSIFQVAACSPGSKGSEVNIPQAGRGYSMAT
jgi:hypothetical protein